MTARKVPAPAVAVLTLLLTITQAAFPWGLGASALVEGTATPILSAPLASRFRATFINIYIRADGSVDPPTAPIRRDGNIYALTDSITGRIVVERSNIVIDGRGHTLWGNPKVNGFSLEHVSNVTIKNTVIKGFSFGIYLLNSFNITIIGNNVMDTYNGIHLLNSSNNIITGNNVVKAYRGIHLRNSFNNTVIGNNVEKACSGIRLLNSFNNTVTGNNLTKNDCNGILLRNSFNNAVIGNNVVRNVGHGILLRNSFNNAITGNGITENSGCGIFLRNSSNNAIIGNNVVKNGEDGIFLHNSSNNAVIGNNVVNNGGGALPWGGGKGISLWNSSNNRIYHNNFVANVVQAESLNSVNVWDDGRKGNYWCNYKGRDVNDDGIGDTPYVIDENNADRHPLTPKLVQGLLRVDSDPQGASVYVDGEFRGRTPLVIQLPPRRYEVKLTKDGYMDYTITVIVEPGKKANVYTRLHAVLTMVYISVAVALVCIAVVVTIILRYSKSSKKPLPPPPP